MNRFGALLLICGLGAGQTVAGSPDPKDLAIPSEDLSKAKALVRKLGSESYRDREDAQEQLGQMGRLAMPALLEAVNADASPEVRFRCSRLLPKAEAADLQARIDTFLADAEAKFDHHLPAWTRYRKEVGNDKAARELYVEMLKSQPNLEILQAIDRSPEAGGRAISDRRAALYLQINPHAFGRFAGGPVTQPKQPALVDVATLLFGETVVPAKDIPKAGLFLMTVTTPMILQSSSVAINAITNPGGGVAHAALFRTVMVRWFDTRIAPEDLSAVVYLAQQLNTLKETTPLLRRIATTDGVQGYAKAQALMMLLQRNGKEEVPFIKTFFQNELLVTQVFLGQNNNVPFQLRDLALALLITRSDQKLQDYGFDFQPGFNVNQPNIGIGGYGFTSDEKREAAFKKFAAWEAKQKDAPKKDEKK